jgi:polar amino acid transport system permease protein
MVSSPAPIKNVWVGRGGNLLRGKEGKMTYTFQWGVLYEWGPYLAKGIWFTIVVSFSSIFFSTIIGLILATIQTFENKILKAASLVYIDIFRTIPLLCLLILIHYVLSVLTGIPFTPVQSAVIALSLNGGALACEAYRGGLEAIPYTQHQAAFSLGFSRIGTLRHITIPQAFFSTLPALTNVYITNIKNTTITMIVAVPEVMFRAQEITVQVFRPLEMYTGAALLYIVFIVAFSYAMRVVEKLQKWQPI